MISNTDQQKCDNYLICLDAGALVVERPADIEEGYFTYAPLIYHFGHKSPNANLQLYNLLISRLAEVVNLRCESNKKGTCLLHKKITLHC